MSRLLVRGRRPGGCASRAAVVLAAAVVAVACAAPPPAMRLESPAKIRGALDLFEDLGAAAQLVPSGGEPGDPVALSRGDDGVSFTGFVEAEPGEYTLEIVFTGVRAGTTERRFLGRWTSNAFTVSQAQAAEPSFTQDVDTIGRPEDGGDADGDGIGYLDEIFAGTDPDAVDSDGDGVEDGADCDPADETRAFTIAAGGSARDCDGDGFERFDVPSGDPGADCDDHDGAVNPSAEDVCTDAIDGDCDANTCPDDDATGPTIDGVATTTGGAIGCQEGVRAHVVDPSTVTNVTVTFVDDPYATTDRVAVMTKGDDDVWTLPSLALYGGTPFRNGAHAIEIKAYDGRGNVATATANIDLQLAAPTVTMTSVLTMTDSPVQLTITPSSARTIASVKLYAAEVRGPGAGGGVQPQWTLVKDVGPSGGTVTVSPADVPGTYEAVVFPVIVDDVGNRLQPSVGYTPSSGAVAADWTCDGVYTRTVPVVARPSTGGASDVVAMEDLLDDAIQAATAAVPGAQLVKVIGFGVRQDGTVDLSSTTNYMRRWAYYFKEPGQDRWLSASWLTAAYTSTNPVMNLDDGSLSETDSIDPATLATSSEATAAFVAADPLCTALTGADGDTVMYVPLNGDDAVYVWNADDTWIGDAETLADLTTSCE